MNTPDKVTLPTRQPSKPSATKPKYLLKRGGVYYFKRKIPADVAHGFPEYREQVWKSLGTGLLHRAMVYLAVEVTEFELKVAQLRQVCAGEWARAVASSASVGQERVAKPRASESLARSERAIGCSDASGPQNTPVHGAMQAKPFRGSGQSAALASAATSPVPPRFASASSAEPRPMVRLDPSVSTVTMLHLFEDWKLKQTRPRTIAAVEKAVMEFRQVCGAQPVEEMTKAHARSYRDHLIEQALSKGTIANRLGFLSTLVRHGMRELVEHLSRNPFDGLEIIGAKGVRVPKERRAYSIKELNQIFSSRLYTEQYRPNGQVVDAAYWVPLLGPFVGARIEELCQLRLDDVQRINGSWCIRVCDLHEDQKTKTFSSFRRVPLSSTVIQCGFLAYAAQMAAAGHERLFPTLSNKNANKTFSNSVGKWWGRYLDSIGLDDSRLDYHSFRYNFKQQCSLCGVSDEVRDALSGHWAGTRDAGRTYLRGENKQYGYPKLVEAINMLSYDELLLQHLYVAEPMKGVEALLR